MMDEPAHGWFTASVKWRRWEERPDHPPVTLDYTVILLYSEWNYVINWVDKGVDSLSSGYTLDRRQIDIRELILNMDHNFKDVVMNITSQKSYVEVLINLMSSLPKQNLRRHYYLMRTVFILGLCFGTKSGDLYEEYCLSLPRKTQSKDCMLACRDLQFSRQFYKLVIKGDKCVEPHFIPPMMILKDSDLLTHV